MEYQISEYVKGGHGRKRGCLLGYKTKTGQVCIGWSLYAKGKEKLPFDAYISKALAYIRAIPINQVPCVPPSLKKAYLKFEVRCKKYFRLI